MGRFSWANSAFFSKYVSERESGNLRWGFCVGMMKSEEEGGGDGGKVLGKGPEGGVGSRHGEGSVGARPGRGVVWRGTCPRGDVYPGHHGLQEGHDRVGSPQLLLAKCDAVAQNGLCGSRARRPRG